SAAALATSILISFSTSTPRARITSTPTRCVTSPAFTTLSCLAGMFPPAGSVARSGNFTRAAEQEHIAQPSLSAQILKLEDELGARLFDRLGRTARLTHFGRTFLPRAEAILRQLGAAKLEIQEMAGGDNGRVVIGAIPTIAPYFLPGPLTSFAIKYPHIKVSIVEEITSVLLQGLHEARLDLALAALPVSGEGLICEELLRERL